MLGLLLAGSLQTVSTIRRSGTGPGRVGFFVPGATPSLSATLKQRENEIADLREKQTKLENVLAQGSGKLKALNDELQNAKLLSGLTEVHGSGIALTLQDGKPRSNRAFDASRFTIHDYDLQMVVNELVASGAEAIAISGQRVVARTAIRCVGPTIMVNSVPVVPPYEIIAIGDPGTMAGGLNMPGGYLDDLRMTDPSMFGLEKRADLVAPAYTGSTEVRWARPVPAQRSEGKDGSGK
jgi:uncharacterized protein YlxW (UPF0749 family)